MSEIRFTNNPRRGDAVLGILGSNKKVFATNGSMLNGTLDTSKYEYIGPVFRRRGKDVLYGYHTTAAKKQSERYSFKLTGYTLDGTDRTGTINLWTSGTVVRDTSYVISYNASDVDSLVSQLNAAFLDTTNYPAFEAQDWYALKESDDSITLHFAYTDYRQASNTGSAGFALTANLLPDWKALANMRRYSGAVGGEGSISSMDRALYYFRSDLNNASYNPTSDVTDVKRTYPICLPGYLGTSQNSGGDHCAALRAVYGNGEAGWLKFMESCRPVLPSDWGTMGIKDGHAITQMLASQTYTSHKVTTPAPISPAADYAANAETTTAPKGTFHEPTTEEIDAILDGIKYGTNSSRNADAVNALQNKMGKSAISNGSYLWSCLRYSANYGWYANGLGGFFSGNSLFGSYTVVPVSHLTLSDSED